MRTVDVAIVGAGLAGSTTAAMLARAGTDAVLVDPRPVYQPDFRCEKFDGSQIALLRKTGLAETIFAASTKADGVWIARFGRLLDMKPSDQYDFRYESVVNALRAVAADGVPFIASKANRITTSADRQEVALANGEVLSARLVVLASGLNYRVLRDIGIEREVLSSCHSVSIGFDMVPVGRKSFAFPSLSYFSERPSDRMAYITLFPIGETMRANLFVYRSMDDPWLREIQRSPQDALRVIMPHFHALSGEFDILGTVNVRPVDLYRAKGHRQAGIVLLGDAFSTSCPAAGTGADKVFVDAERLCHVHLPDWLSTPGMDATKIDAFYDDPVKTDCEEASLRKALRLRKFSLDPGLAWTMRRWIWFAGHMGLGIARRTRQRLGAAPASAGSAEMPPILPRRSR